MKKIMFIFLLIILSITSCATAKTDCLTFKSKKTQNVHIQVYNALGVQVNEFEITASEGINSYNIQNYIENNGVYFIVVKYNDNDEAPYWSKTVKLDITKLDYGLH